MRTVNPIRKAISYAIYAALIAGLNHMAGPIMANADQASTAAAKILSRADGPQVIESASFY